MRRDDVKALFELAGFTVHAMWELPNGYWPEAYIEMRTANPWWLVRTEFGCIQIGRRKRVWCVDWSDTKIRGKVTETPNVTSEDTFSHAWDMPDLIKYLTELHALGAAS